MCHILCCRPASRNCNRSLCCHSTAVQSLSKSLEIADGLLSTRPPLHALAHTFTYVMAHAWLILGGHQCENCRGAIDIGCITFGQEHSGLPSTLGLSAGALEALEASARSCSLAHERRTGSRKALCACTTTTLSQITRMEAARHPHQHMSKLPFWRNIVKH